MGYNTDFKGELKFVGELNQMALATIKTFLGEDYRNHPEWGNYDLTYINLEFLDDFSGLRWDGNEKTYCMVDCVNLIIENMRKKYTDFGLTGELLAQGERIDDRWKLIINREGMAEMVEMVEMADYDANNITSISKNTNSSLSVSPRQIFEEALESLDKEGAFKKGNKALVLMLDDTPGRYLISYINSGMRESECVALLECAKSTVKTELGY